MGLLYFYNPSDALRLFTTTCLHTAHDMLLSLIGVIETEKKMTVIDSQWQICQQKEANYNRKLYFWHHYVFLWTAVEFVNNGNCIVADCHVNQYNLINCSLHLMHVDRDWKSCSNARQHRVRFGKETLIWGFYWICVLFCHKVGVCTLCHFVLIWRTVTRTTEFESSSFVWSWVCVFPLEPVQ